MPSLASPILLVTMRANILLTFLFLLLTACQPKAPRDINIGFIGPLTGNAVDFGVGPAQAMTQAVEEYNEQRQPDQPQVNFFIEDDQWTGENAIPLYDNLRKEHGVELLLISHTDGTIALQEKVLADRVILINSLNNDALLSSMNENTFMIGKKTEEAAQTVAARVIELGLKKVAGLYVTNRFMEISAETFREHLAKQWVEADLVPVDIEKESYLEELQRFKDTGSDALVFFGYKNLGYAMKQARELGIEAPFFASATILGKGYYENSGGALDGTEFSMFTANDGNYIVAKQFLDRYRRRYGSEPFPVWPAMQGYDAMNMVLGILGRTREKPAESPISAWVKSELLDINFYQGVCGNLAILEDGSSRGIYFSLYQVKGNGEIEKVKR